jgi:hypothetical protein
VGAKRGGATRVVRGHLCRVQHSWGNVVGKAGGRDGDPSAWWKRRAWCRLCCGRSEQASAGGEQYEEEKVLPGTIWSEGVHQAHLNEGGF